MVSHRADGRSHDQLRQVRFTRGWLSQAEGSVLVEFGQTRVLVAASVTEGVPRWRKGSGLGWVTSEYAMLPRATSTRTDRESVRGRIGGRTHEISRLIGRSLRAVIDYKALGENTIVLDCDVLQADGGTRTASITGAYVALADAVSWLRERNLLTAEPLTGSVAAVSVGVVDGTPMLDLCYTEDSAADTDMNVVMSGDGAFIEVQGTAEGAPFDRRLLDELLDLARHRLRATDHAATGRACFVMTDCPSGGAGHQQRPEAGRAAADRGSGSAGGTRCSDLPTSPRYPEPAETERTFEGNALLKARACVAATGLPALADDSGSGGRRTQQHARRPLGALGRPEASDEDNNELLLRQLADVPAAERTARFVCAMALVLPDGTEHVRLGEMSRPARSQAPVGDNGFGYDPLFVADGYTVTNGELEPAAKDAISHRGRAVRAIAAGADRELRRWKPAAQEG